MSAGAKKGLAVLAAVVLVLGAIGVRALIDGGGDDGGGPDRPEGAPRLLCATELVQACQALDDDSDVEITYAPAGTTFDELRALPDADLEALGYDGWLTFARDAEMVTSERERQGLEPALGDISSPIGRSPLLIAAWKERADALAPRCGGEVTWKCIGDVAGRSWASVGGQAAWGTVKVGHPGPDTTGTGLGVIGQAAAQFFGRSDLDRADVQDDPEFLDWFEQLERSVDIGDAPVHQMLLTRAAEIDFAATTEADAGPELARASRDLRDQVRLIYPSPVATVDVVFAPIAGRDTDLGDLVTGDDGRSAVARAGYRVDDEDRAPGVPDRPPLPARSNLPDPGTLVALLETWHGVVG
jgi:hypothetical protein